MKLLGFVIDAVAKLPFEKWLFKAPSNADRLRELQSIMEADRKPAPAAAPPASVAIPEAAPALDLPTKAETLTLLKRRLGMELYKAELDLAAGLRINGKPCTCLESKHTLQLEAGASELIPEEPDNTVYRDIIEWIRDNQHKVTPAAIASDKYKAEYPHMSEQFKHFRKRVMGTESARDMVQRTQAPAEETNVGASN